MKIEIKKIAVQKTKLRRAFTLVEMLLADEFGREMNKRVRVHSEVILEWRKQRVVVNFGPLQRRQILRASMNTVSRLARPVSNDP